MIAIFTTLGVTQPLLASLRENGLLEPLFVLGMALIGAAIVVQGFRLRPNGVEIAVALGVVAVYLLLFTRMAIPEERTHLIEYGVVALLIYEALQERASQCRPVPFPAMLTVFLTALLGWLDEGLQAMVPNRFYDLRDVGFNALAGLMAVTATVLWTRARQWRQQ